MTAEDKEEAFDAGFGTGTLVRVLTAAGVVDELADALRDRIAGVAAVTVPSWAQFPPDQVHAYHTRIELGTQILYSMVPSVMVLIDVDEPTASRAARIRVSLALNGQQVGALEFAGLSS